METTTGPVARTYPTIGQSVAIVGLMIGLVLLLSPVTFVLVGIAGREISMFVYYLLATGGSFWIVYLIRRSTTGENTFTLTFNNPRIVVLSVIATIALVFGVISPLVTAIPMPEFFQSVFKNLMMNDGVLGFAMIVIAAPVLEELIFRGIMLDGLLKKYSPVKSILISSTLFGLVHLNPWQFITAFVIGCFSGWVYYKTRNLTPSIIIHAATNLVSFLSYRFSNKEAMFDNNIAEMYGSMGFLVAVVVGCWLIIWACVRLLDFEFKRINVPPGGTA